MNKSTAFIMTHEPDPNRTTPAMSIIALALTRSLGRRGVNVVRIHPNDMDYSLRSRFCRKVEICPDFYKSEDALLNYLLQLSAEYPEQRILFPASDDTAYFLAKYKEELALCYSVIVSDWEVMEKLTNKRLQYAEAEKIGIPIPETYFPSTTQEVEKLSSTLENYPYIIKPNVAHKWRLASMQSVSKGKKAFIASTPRELVDRYRELGLEGHDVMIQERIGGRDERLYTFLCYFNSGSEPHAYCIRRKYRQTPIDFGYCTSTVTCHNQSVEDLSVRLLSAIGFKGIGGVEWKLDPRTDAYKLIEINPRPVNTIGAAIAAGVDLPYIAFQDASINDVAPKVSTWKDGVKWVWLTQDVWSAKELHDKGLLSYWEWLKSIRGKKYHAIFAIDDLKPFVLSFLVYAREIISLKLQKGIFPSRAKS